MRKTKLRNAALWAGAMALAAFVTGSTGWIVSAGQAQEVPKCNQDTFGQVACFSIKLCECIYDRGGAMTGLPARYRWDCGILRPRCEEAPTSIIEYRGTPLFYPYAVGIDIYHPKRTVN